MAVELATAYISLVPTTQNIKPAMEKQFAPVPAIAEEAGRESGNRFADGFKAAGSRIGSALAGTMKAGISVASAAAVAASAVGIKTAAAAEQSEIAFSTMLGSGEKAKSFLADLSKFAAKTPFDLPGLEKSASSLVSAGIDASKVIPIMTSLGNATSGMGTGAEGIQRATVALQQMNAAGKISGEDLNQLRDAGIPVFDLLTAATGKTTAQIAEMADKGKLGRKELDQLMSALESGKGLEKFNGLMEKQSASLTGMWSTLKDTFSTGMAEAVKPLIPLLKDGLGGATAFLTEKALPKAKIFFTELAGGITAFSAAWAANDGDVTSSGFPGFMERAAFITRQVWETAREAIASFTAAWQYNDGEITSSGFNGFMEVAGYRLHQVWDALTGLYALLVQGDFTGAFSRAFNVEEDHPAVGFLFDLRQNVIDTVAAIKETTGNLWAGLSMDSATRAQMEGQLTGAQAIGANIRDFFGDVWAGMQKIDFSSFDAFFASLQEQGGPVAQSLGSIGESFKTLWPAIQEFGKQAPDLASGGLSLLAKGLEFLADHVDDIIAWMPAIVAGFVAWKVAQVGLAAAQQAAIPVQLILNITRIAAARAERDNAIAIRQATAATAQSTTANNVSLGTRLRNTAALIAQKTATIATTVATRAAAAGQWLLNAAMTANPIGIIVAAIVALVAGLIWFFTQTELGQQIIQNVWGAIQSFIGGTVQWFQDHVLPVILDVFHNVGAVFEWLYKNIVEPVFGFIQAVVAGVVAWFTGTLVPGVQGAFAAVGAVFTWLYENIILPYVNFWMTIFNALWLVVKFIFEAIVAVIEKIVIPAIVWFYENVIKPVFDGIAAVFTWIWDNIVSPYFNFWVDLFTKTIPGAINWLHDNVIKPVFDKIGEVFTWIWDNIVSPYMNFWIDLFQNKIPAAINWLHDNVIKPVFDKIGEVFTWIWDNIVSPYMNFWIDLFTKTIPNAVTWLYENGIKPIFDKIGEIIKWVWENVIKPVFDTFSNVIEKELPKAFEAGKKIIEDIWNGIQEIVKAPIRFVVNTVLNDGLIKSMNDIAGLLGIKPLPTIVLPPGFREGGYTGNRPRGAIAGVVHGDEHVIRSESRRRMEAAMPGLLEHINRFGTLFGYAGGGRVAPLKELLVTQGYNRVHKGIDYAAQVGTPVFATQDGVVSHAGPGAQAPGVWGGQEVHILGSGLETWYAHLSKIAVKVGENIRAGQMIALSGNTGISSGPHLHFGVFQGGWPNDMDPVAYLGGAGAPNGEGFNPIAAIIDALVAKFKEAFPQGGAFIDLVGGFGKKILIGAADFITSIFAGSKDKKGQAVGATVFDGGGWLENTGGPQLIEHNRRRPDAVLSSSQWDTMATIAQHAEAGTAITFNGPVYGNPQHIVDEIEARKRRAATRGNLRAITVGG
jgi:tape measure domain-containing protein